MFTQTVAKLIAGKRFRVAVDSLENNCIEAVLVSNLPESDRSIVIGGMPVALYDLGEGRYAIGAFALAGSTLGDGSVSDQTTHWGGQRMTLGVRNGAYIFSVKDGTVDSDQDAVSQEVVYGHRIGKDAGDRMILASVTGAYQELGKAYIGGMPLLVVRQNNRWHLAIRTLS